ncbi:MAG: GntR family transcriptional regulator [Faecalibacterium sp.]
MMGLTPIQIMPARDRVASALREAILSHQFSEGQELTLKDTAASLGVSATPIREAFQILEREGLIALRPNRGAVVLGMSEKRIRDHYETRAALERAAVRLACCNGADLSRVKSAYQQAEQALAQNNSERYSAQNQAFHMEIWKASGNEKILELLSSLWNGLSMGHKVTQEEYARISMSEHKIILEAMESGNEDKAGNLMEAHILRSMLNVLTHLRTPQNSL